ncbi:UNVERIFIED_CONTAM: hypothetical protein FKN15_050615 [Acipenser sinensis]
MTCTLRAVHADKPADASNKACSYQKQTYRWVSEDGSSAVCGCCDAGSCFGTPRFLADPPPKQVGRLGIPAGINQPDWRGKWLHKRAASLDQVCGCCDAGSCFGTPRFLADPPPKQVGRLGIPAGINQPDWRGKWLHKRAASLDQVECDHVLPFNGVALWSSSITSALLGFSNDTNLALLSLSPSVAGQDPQVHVKEITIGPLTVVHVVRDHAVMLSKESLYHPLQLVEEVQDSGSSVPVLAVSAVALALSCAVLLAVFLKRCSQSSDKLLAVSS